MENIRKILNRGIVIPAHPLALNAQRKLDERRQRALSRYYLAAGAGGLAVGVHTTQFAIHDPKVGLLEPVLQLAREEMDRADEASEKGSGPFCAQHPPGRSGKRDLPPFHSVVRVAGICGRTAQAVGEAELARGLDYQAGLLNVAAMHRADEDGLIAHCRAVAEVIPVFGFYLQAGIGGRELPYSFWRRMVEIENVVAIKIAAFDRYRTIDVVRAVAESGRDDIALYTGNDDTIVADLITPHRFATDARPTTERRFVGGLLGHWAVWTRKAVELLTDCHRAVRGGGDVPAELLRRSVEVTDCNAAFFDAANHFAGCVPGLLEVLRRQGLLEGIWCLNPDETLSPGQREEIDRVCRMYPHLADDEFVAEHRDQWLGG
ncbi:MAG: dihydrodipicolinate synthase family protein [Planctomycetes bacterium]|nr:dihydrodipicolinate synthase family protein [Planctomycetota bacterium]